MTISPLSFPRILTAIHRRYFCEFIIKPYLEHAVHSNYINKKVLDKYWDVGGVRIEDDLLVLEHGNENLTTAPTGSEMLALVTQGGGGD